MTAPMGTVPGPSARAVLARHQPIVEASLARVLAAHADGIAELQVAAIRYALEAGGKRLRPILCMSACRALGGPDSPCAWDAASALEIIHTYSLVHDDLPSMDNDDLRRGRPTTHRAFDEGTAAVAGAVMIPLACSVLEQATICLGFTPLERARAVRELTAGAGAAGMVGGQVLDLAAEDRDVGAAELEAIHSRKTGALFAASMRLGGRLARADDAVLDALGDCGQALGLAFQVTDDVLDVTSEASVLGKTAGRDRVRGKATYPGLLGLGPAKDRAGGAAAAAVQALHRAGLQDGTLESLIDFAVSRDR